ncbi:MAG: cyclase family protein [Clostridia bacterium]|nr:cyclase family protein [Clostridia bacterium]
MQVMDLTHIIKEGMPVFPGTESPMIKQALTIEADRSREKLITMFSHTGTHMDAPAHMIPTGKTLDALPIDHFVGSGLVIDCRDVLENRIELSLLKTHEDRIVASEYVLFCTGWSERWGTPRYFEEFPALTLEAAQWLADQGLKGVGIDTISIDHFSAEVFEVHHVLLGANMVVVENLKELEGLLEKAFTLSVLPLKILEADGSPVRAVAMY